MINMFEVFANRTDMHSHVGGDRFVILPLGQVSQNLRFALALKAADKVPQGCEVRPD
jgi:hypothetical protein